MIAIAIQVAVKRRPSLNWRITTSKPQIRNAINLLAFLDPHLHSAPCTNCDFQAQRLESVHGVRGHIPCWCFRSIETKRRSRQSAVLRKVPCTSSATNNGRRLILASHCSPTFCLQLQRTRSGQVGTGRRGALQERRLRLYYRRHLWSPQAGRGAVRRNGASRARGGTCRVPQTRRFTFDPS